MVKVSRMRTAPVAPVRFPLALGDCLRAVLSRGPQPPGLFVSSGQEALELALRGVKQLHAEDRGEEVIVPDFICPSVPAAVRDAGLVPRLCELEARTWFYRQDLLAEAVGPSTCAVVMVSYFGFAPAAPPGLDALLERTAVVEDLAQSYGITELRAPWDRPAFRAYSFARGKSLPLGWGGLVVGGGDVERRWLETLGRRRVRGGVLESVLNLALSQVQSLVLHPAVWRRLPVPERFPPAAGAKGRRGDPRWPVTRYVGASRSLAPEIAIRRRNAQRLARQLRGCPGLHLPATDEGALSRAAALRFPIIFEEAAVAGEVRRLLAEERIVKGPNDFDDYGNASANAATIARCLVTLPTYRGSEAAQEAATAMIRQVSGRSWKYGT